MQCLAQADSATPLCTLHLLCAVSRAGRAVFFLHERLLPPVHATRIARGRSGNENTPGGVGRVRVRVRETPRTRTRQ